ATTTGCLAFGGYSELEQARQNGELRKACARHGHPVQPPRRLNSTTRLGRLRTAMASEVALGTAAVHAYLITSSDEHQSTDVDEFDKRWEFISGFSGSYGNIVVTGNKAALWTDGRFYLQADEEIDCNWLLFKEGERKTKTISEWLKQALPRGGRLGLYPKLVSQYMWNKLFRELEGTGIEMVGLNVSLIDEIWPDELRKSRRSKEAFYLDEIYTGKNYTTKINETRRRLQKHGADAMVITALDEIAWLLNVRGRDVPNSPYVRSYVILDMNNIFWYVNGSQIPENVRKQLHSHSRLVESDTVTLKPYEQIWPDLGTKSQLYKKILIPSHCVYSEGASHAIYEHVFHDRRLLVQSPIIYLKAVKNPTEIEWMKSTNIKDAAAVCDCFAFVQKKMNSNERITEVDLVEYLNEYRYEQNHSLGNSFRTRVGFGANGAFPNYESTLSSNVQIFKNSTLVLDSGGQYHGGTTEVTRTLHFGEPTEEMKEAYTRVLIGLISLSTLTFPSNMKMAVSDAVARASLWEVGLDYPHETGHGIGSFLGVNESPVKVHFDSEVSGQQAFKPGYFLSNGPGYYREGMFGVRLENVMEVVEKPWLNYAGNTYLGFKTITFVPFEPNLIKLSLLSVEQRKWLNEYNEQVRHLVGEELKRQKRMDGFYYMMDKTQYIPENKSPSFRSTFCLVIFLNIFLLFNKF
ncbi:unnamed protein product, partial [Phyllotreta striolata]